LFRFVLLFAAGDNMGRYRVIKELGAGAAGGVFLVEDAAAGGAIRALKRIEARSDPDFRTSFAREFAMLASLSIRGVARVFDLGALPAEGDLPAGPYFTREFIPGTPLDAYAVQRGLDERLRVFLALSRIVRALHRRGVVHGDIKPANVIVDPSGEPWLIDFGLSARAVDADAVRGSGTLSFMAPELLRGGRPSPASDVYALAATLHQLVTGAPPQPVINRGGRASKRPPLASTAGESAVLAVVAAGLAAEPSERVCSADELCARLEALPNMAPAEPAQQLKHAPRPRMRGRDGLLAELEQSTVGAAAELVVVGAEGLGKSVLLRELKWRLQLAGRVVRFVAGQALGVPPSVQLAEQTRAANGDSAGPSLAECLRAPAGGERCVLLVDDLDALDPVWVRELVACLHDANAADVPHVVATAADGQCAAVQLLGDANVQSLARLGSRDMGALLQEVLGAVDSAAAAELLRRVEGSPGALIAAADALQEKSVVTFADVEGLSVVELTGGGVQRRLAQLDEAARTSLLAVSLARAPLPHSFLNEVVGQGASDARYALVVHELVSDDGRATAPLDLGILEQVCAGTDAARRATLAERMAATEGFATLPPDAAARIALEAQDRSLAAALWRPAAAALRASGAVRDERALLEGVRTLVAGPEGRAASLLLGELCSNTGEGAIARRLAGELLAQDDLTPDEDARCRIFGARALIAAGEIVPAQAMLAATHADAPASLRACALCELARIRLRTGAFEGAGEAAAVGLTLAPPTDVARAELMAIAGTLHARRGGGDGAMAELDAAVQFAQAHGTHRERALVSGYFALELDRSGQLPQAKERYEAAMAEARSAGDVGQMATYAMNLGNVEFRLGDIERSEQRFVLAARLARRAERTSVALVAEVNLASVLVHLGAYARARSVVEGCRRAAGDADLSLLVAQSTHVLATIDARTEQTERALSGFGHARAQFDALNRKREACEVLLDTAEALLDRGGVSDASAASAALAQARGLIDGHALHDFQLNYELLAARARMQNGDVDGAVRELKSLETRARVATDRDMHWKAAHALAVGYAQAGALLVAEAAARDAAEIVESQAMGLSPDLRDGFRRDPRRRAALVHLEALKRGTERNVISSGSSDTRVVHGVDARFKRLLDVNKRLARERDLDRILERITDTAVELSGAERGFVLLVDAQGELGTHVVRVHGGVEGDPHVAFSRSIAESVLIDGEPIVTMNARDDRRLHDFLSVHKLMLKSVACIPINGKERTLGVLYLEHRVRAGRFDEHDLDLLLAFADQAAIAIENGRLWAEVEAQREALTSANQHLREAKDELERVLHARTEELEDVRQHLEQARTDASGKSGRFGVIGHSAAMMRVISLLERVQDNHVPVVVQGESGTGKELIARAIHFGGKRAAGPFVTLNCAAIPDSLVESELFGHVRGAFTGADRERKGVFVQAHGGTLFLDEFAEASPRLQVSLLRVLQEARVLPLGADAELAVDVRIVVGSQQPLSALVAQGKVREDLYYRLSVVEVRLPPLRERRDDIPALCEHLLRVHAQREQCAPKRLARDALELLMRHPLPGNVRQLEHLLVSASMMAEGRVISAQDLGGFGDGHQPGASAESEAETHSSSLTPAELPEDLGAFKAREKAKILEALERHAWNRAKAAHELGMPRRTFYRRLTEFGILEASEGAN
jgi:serine/threonine-protein kinase PknK